MNVFLPSLIHVVIRCAMLMISGLVTYHLILSKIWNLEVSVLHLGRGQETSLERCAIPWAANVPVIQSFAAELLGTFILDIGKIYYMMNYIYIRCGFVRILRNQNQNIYSYHFCCNVAINLVMDNPTMQNNEPMFTAGIVSGLIALVVTLAFDIR